MLSPDRADTADGSGPPAAPVEGGPPAVATLNVNQRARRDRIVDAALEMMLVTDHTGIQMKAVSAAAGVALGTTYRYFPSKDQLLAEALLRWGDRFPALEGRGHSGRSVDQLKAVYRLVVRAFEPHPTMYAALVALETSPDPVVGATFERFASHTRAGFARAIPRVSSPRRENVIMVMSSVLDNQLRHWSVGLVPVESVYRSLDVTADLLLGD